ncbi:hypothetical protein A3Q40_03135 [Rhodococcus sp. PBTS 1]|nr:hypothetical protein A3Q40_03135 [Rhodococcus sp. PBTS 1]
MPELDHDVARVRALLGDLGLESMVDIHTHFMPHNVLAKVWGYFDAVEPRLGQPWPIEYRTEEDARTQRLRAYGVERFTSLLYPHKPGMAQWLNGWAGEFADRTPDCVRTGTFYPEAEAASYVRAAIDDGVGILKCHVQVGDYDVHDPLLDDVWGAIQDAGIPVVIHCGSGPEPGRFTGPDPVEALMRRYPRLPLVIAHMGMPEYAQFLDLADRYERVRLDTTMVFTAFTERLAPFPVDLRPRLLDLQKRILFGSDFPNIPYPYADALRAVMELGLGDDWARDVVRENGRGLVG